mmetsp:Transcript_9058/g.7976  ORF Transcript_9058/g.7976 Transcript_9058/m.7976 type:complete len:127 (+) Transcript_9058:655-1035(+)|eukprot:CAMPEP_0114589064 /NCGR_PEP_ID=MMETSP0125-20121206/11615_1 /TAXON_ID=485358 ORGANISM="Aristerostoma sp., Strain ATCC 50986" /NCGR_SAMPLE_ID=MMETSP0125 /ASSEMBLY_ACC=CAM_ASM_000245 /LENGTH=126 /DNA_ID=CAMNT_0001785783 /DNA_START=595 /DNA_END=975 /DNA_ORIENTATION=-
MIKGLDMTEDQFIDLCILCGCDYTESIEGIGPITAFKFMKECGSLEKVLAKLEEDNKSTTKKKKYTIPSPYPYEDARELFKKPVVFQDIDKLEIKWKKPDEEQLKNLLVEEKGFSETRVENALKKL